MERIGKGLSAEQPGSPVRRRILFESQKPPIFSSRASPASLRARFRHDDFQIGIRGRTSRPRRRRRRRGAAPAPGTPASSPAPARSLISPTPPPSAPSSPPSVPPGSSSRPQKSAASRPTADFPVEFLLDNLKIQNNLIESAHRCRRREAPLPRQLLHLPEVRPPAHPRDRAAHRRARAHQRALRPCQDRRHQALPGLRPRVWRPLHLRHAHQPLRPRR